MSELEQLYQEVVLDHARNRRGFGLAPGAAESHQINPTCGDEVTLRLSLDDAGAIRELTWEGRGCAISQSSASMLAEVAPGSAPAELQARIDAFRDMMRSRGQLEGDEELLGDAVVFRSASKYTARIKCAMLAWVAAEDALSRLP
jgi:nitrogen fixation NifU-like protein